MTDLGALGLFAAALVGAVALGEGLRLAGWRPESTRRVVHVLVGLAVAGCPPWFSGPGPIYVLAIVFLVGNVVAVRQRWMPGMHAIERRSWGTVTFPLALLVALGLCWTLDPSRVYVLQTAFVVLALADPAASLLGEWVGRPVRIGGAMKSAAGSAAFLLVATVSAAWALDLTTTLGAVDRLGWALTAAALATLAEALGKTGWDNLWIVLAVVVSLSWLDADPEGLGRSFVALAIAAGFGMVAYRARFLDRSGVLAASGLAWMVVALGGVAWIVPAVTFFVLSSLLSRLGRRRKAEAEALAEKGSRRDAGQVAANGGVGAALLAASVFVPSDGALGMLYTAFVGAFAAAAADTWATEIGTLVRGTTRKLLVGPVIPPGTSGGMSVAGTAGALLGATVVVASAVASGAGGLRWAFVVAAAGVGGSVVDSVLGATLQARYRLPDGRLTETPRDGDAALPLAAGVSALTNDGVNWVCTAAGASLAALAVLAV